MISRALLILIPAAAILADPVPAPLAQVTLDPSSFPRDLAGDASEIPGFSSLLDVISDMPTLPGSVLSVLETAVPSSDLSSTGFGCIPTSASGCK